ncbi:type IV pilin [Halorussus halobius]|uniref:type IV pilin n=1 Tax=Halorussus halobius TaxID=1710537 RepID=UPI0010918E54|nr:type IV pilin N-terminal domain-containing protein [Halorussus halobius]
MKLKNLRSDDSAVSPVIGVILMVAITVILAAVIGTFVLDLGNQVQSSSPTASFSFDQHSNSSVTVTHDGGDTIPHSNIEVTVNGSDAKNNGGSKVWNSGEVSAGNSAQIVKYGQDANNDVSSDDIIRVVWTSDSGENSQVLAEYTVA